MRSMETQNMSLYYMIMFLVVTDSFHASMNTILYLYG